jgi:hypothetical protein
MAMTHKKPTWWTGEHDSSWDRVKAAFRRDWEQTKHDFGADEPDLDQDVDDTVKQAAGKQPIPPPGVPNFEEYEPAFKFGYGARQHYGSKFSQWNDDLETNLKRDYGEKDWNVCRRAVRRGWDFGKTK